ncbi:MAG: type I-MYXAN CRISPR-associated Cas8a1/Cmx1 [Pyrinomonadaceae bacterium]|nr:type I-MYXAN CRISPR-associated Cas8a1/Cmx1 [Pyrinomonadaceae bacterium]
MAEMILKLNSPGMTSLHKAGLAGLYMTLRAFNKNEVEIEGLEWKLEKKQIVLNWTDETPKNAFEKLVKESFRVDEEGFIRLSGLEPRQEMTLEQKHFLYQGLLNSFLQFGPHRPTGNKRTLMYKLDQDSEKSIFIKDFAPIKKIRQHETTTDFIDKNGNFKTDLNVAGWLYPGASQRHVAHAQTTLNESLNLAFTLLFAPVGVIYYLIRSKAKGRKSRLALLIPEIKDLEAYAEVRQVIASQGVIDLTASSSSDAALRMLIALEANSSSNEFARRMRENFLCRIITFGIVGWNEKQKSRTSTRTVISGKLKGFENYHKAFEIFKNKWQQVKEKRDRNDVIKEPEHFFVTTFCGREMIADNIANNKSWYHNISEFLANRETREQLYYEQKELGQMVNEAEYEDENVKLFIQICHKSWQSRLRKLRKRADEEKLGDDGFFKLIKKEREKLRSSYARCKNAETLRENVVDFWSRGGSNKLLQGDGLIKVLPLFSEKQWRKAKDLALLALVSYQPQNKEENQLLNTEIEIEGEDEL